MNIKKIKAISAFVGITFTFVFQATTVAQSPLDDLLGSLGDSVVESGEFVYRLQRTKTLDDTVYQRQVVDIIDSFKSRLSESLDPLGTELLLEGIATFEKDGIPELRNQASDQMVVCLIAGNQFGSPRRYDFRSLVKTPGPDLGTGTVLMSFDGRGSGASLSSFGSLDKSFVAGPIYPGSQEPQTLGRLVGAIRYMSNDGVRFEDFVDDVVVVNESYPELNLKVTLHANPYSVREVLIECNVENGFITPKVIEYDSLGRKLNSWVCGSFFKLPSGDYFPQSCEYESLHYGGDAEKPTIEVTKEIYSFDVNLTKPQTVISLDRFDVVIPKDSQLIDLQHTQNSIIVPTQPVLVTGGNLDKLRELPGLNPVRTNVSGAGNGFRVILLFLSAGVAAFLVVFFKKRMKRVPLIVLLCVSLSFSGCTRDGFDLQQSNQKLFIDSEVVDFDEVATDTDLDPVPILFRNDGENTLDIKLETDCNCVHLTASQFRLAPQETFSVSVSIGKLTRTGKHQNRILVSSGILNSHTVETREIVVVAHKLESFTLLPTGFALEKESLLVGKPFALIGPQLSDLSFDFPDGIELTTLSSEPIGDLMKTSFSIRGSCSMPSVVVNVRRPTNRRDIATFKIPIKN